MHIVYMIEVSLEIKAMVIYLGCVFFHLDSSACCHGNIILNQYFKMWLNLSMTRLSYWLLDVYTKSYQLIIGKQDKSICKHMSLVKTLCIHKFLLSTEFTFTIVKLS